MPLTRTYSDCVLTDVTHMTFHRGRASSTGWYITAGAQIRAGDGKHYMATITKEATEGQIAAIENFITNQVIAAVNAQEGLA